MNIEENNQNQKNELSGINLSQNISKIEEQKCNDFSYDFEIEKLNNNKNSKHSDIKMQFENNITKYPNNEKY